MATICDIVIDCRHPASLARFWAAALDGYAIAPYDDQELARLRSMGIDDPEDDPTVLVEAASGARPRSFIQRVPEPKSGKNRVHLDFEADDYEGEIKRLVGLGASVVAEHSAGGDFRWSVLRDPEGNEFDVSVPHT